MIRNPSRVDVHSEHFTWGVDNPYFSTIKFVNENEFKFKALEVPCVERFENTTQSFQNIALPGPIIADNCICIRPGVELEFDVFKVSVR